MNGWLFAIWMGITIQNCILAAWFGVWLGRRK